MAGIIVIDNVFIVKDKVTMVSMNENKLQIIVEGGANNTTVFGNKDECMKFYNELQKNFLGEGAYDEK